jgi:hypothetical protein
METPGTERTADFCIDEPKIRRFLLEDARSRFKAEQDRYGQLFSRAAIYLGILAVYMGVLVRFYDRPPLFHLSFASVVFGSSALVLSILVVFAGAHLVRALMPRVLGQATLPSELLTWLPGLRRAHLKKTDGELSADDLDRLDEELSRIVESKLLANFAEAANSIAETNEVRSQTLYKASRAVQLGLAALVIAVTSYAYLGLSGTTRDLDTVPSRDHSGTTAANGEQLDKASFGSATSGPVKYVGQQAGGTSNDVPATGADSSRP